MNWNWSNFVGSKKGLEYNRRELDNLASVVKMVPNKVAAVQAGGNLGIFPKYLAAHFGMVYTFEPDAECFAALCHNAPENNIIKLQAAVGHERKTVSIRQDRRDGKPETHEGTRWVDENGFGIVPVFRIDDLNLRSCDLIYLDVEGFEFQALRGARETIRLHSPIVAVEMNKNLKYVGLNESDVITSIRMMGYELDKQLGSDFIFKPRSQALKVAI